jgi:hypothetical protein
MGTLTERNVIVAFAAVHGYARFVGVPVLFDSVTAAKVFDEGSELR